MTKSIQKLFTAIAVILLLTTVTSCKKDNFDEPPVDTVDPNLTVTHTIRQLKDLYTGANLKLTDDIIITGIVVANDKSGNIFNQIIIDDGSAGISVGIDQNGLNGEFPVGRKVYIKCKDLYLAAANNLVGLYGALDITGSTVEIPAGLTTKFVVKANSGNPVVPIEINSISRLNDSFQNRLIKISNVEFNEEDAGQPYADAVNKVSVSRFFKQCGGQEMEIRTSGYANFAAKLTPTGSGSITGIYTVYRTDKQLILRNENEVELNDTNRCAPISIYNPISIFNLRAKYLGSNIAVGENVTITGVVISSISDSNNLAQNLTIQDGSAGIVVRLVSSNPNFNKGDQVQIKVPSASILQRFSNGSMQVGSILNANVTRTATGVAVTPQVVTVATLIANFDNYESELVQVNGVTISGAGGLYNGTITFNDGTASIASFVRPTSVVPSAEFVNQAYPTGTVSIVGYANLNGSTKQLILRNTTDVTP